MENKAVFYCFLVVCIRRSVRDRFFNVLLLF